MYSVLSLMTVRVSMAVTAKYTMIYVNTNPIRRRRRPAVKVAGSFRAGVASKKTSRKNSPTAIKVQKTINVMPVLPYNKTKITAS